VFSSGKLESSGIYTVDGTDKNSRLVSLQQVFKEEFSDPVDVLVLEDIWGYIASQSLVQACGVIIGSVGTPHVIELNVSTWKAVATRLGGWEKGDESDAIYMGVAAMCLADGYSHKRLKNDKKRKELLDSLAVANDYWNVDTIREVYERGEEAVTGEIKGTEVAGGVIKEGPDET
jgi:hypothetical protein